MKDRYFYLFVILVIVGIITLALKPGSHSAAQTNAQIAAQGFRLENYDLERLTAAPGTVLSFSADAFDKTYYATLSTNIPRNMSQASAGVFATLGPQFESVFADQVLILEIEARANQSAPLQDFDVGYFTAGTGDSGWKRYVLSDQFQTYGFEFTPKKGKSPGNDYFGIWPGDAGDNAAMDVLAIRIRIKAPNTE